MFAPRTWRFINSTYLICDAGKTKFDPRFRYMYVFLSSEWVIGIFSPGVSNLEKWRCSIALCSRLINGNDRMMAILASLQTWRTNDLETNSFIFVCVVEINAQRHAYGSNINYVPICVAKEQSNAFVCRSFPFSELCSLNGRGRCSFERECELECRSRLLVLTDWFVGSGKTGK